jgi:hypothetical protein
VPEDAPLLDQRANRERALYVVDIVSEKVTRLSR